MATTYYIDLDLATSGGAGTTTTDPYNATEGIAAIMALAGDEGGDTYLFKRGSSHIVTTSIQILTAASASNFNLGAYGTGALPIFDGQNNEASKYLFELQAIQNVIIRDLYITNAKAIGILIKPTTGTVSNVEVYGCSFIDIGVARAADTHDAINIQGRTAAYATGCKFKHNYINNTGNNGLEISFCDGFHSSDNIYIDCFNNAIELWDQCDNGVHEKETMNGCRRMAWTANEGGLQHTNNTFKNNLVYNIGVHAYKDENSTGTVIDNCTFHIAAGSVDTSTRMVSIVGADAAASITIRNNIFMLGVPAASVGFMIFFQSANISTATIDSNVYFYHTAAGVASDLKFNDNTANRTKLTEWTASANTPAGTDANSVEDSDPLFTDILNGDAVLLASSPALYETLTEVAGTVVDDLNRDARYGGIDAGALQYQRHTSVTVGSSIDK